MGSINFNTTLYAIYQQRQREAVPGTSNAARLAHMRRQLHRAMEEELTPRQQQAIRLCYGRGLSMSAAAKEMGLAHSSSVCRLIQRAVKRLSRALKYSDN